MFYLYISQTLRALPLRHPMQAPSFVGKNQGYGLIPNSAYHFFESDKFDFYREIEFSEVIDLFGSTKASTLNV